MKNLVCGVALALLCMYTLPIFAQAIPVPTPPGGAAPTGIDGIPFVTGWIIYLVPFVLWAMVVVGAVVGGGMVVTSLGNVNAPGGSVAKVLLYLFITIIVVGFLLLLASNSAELVTAMTT